ncbi:unnamed protein product [Boreogadus saida]
MVVHNPPKTRGQMLDRRLDPCEHPSVLQPQVRGGHRRGRCKGSDGSSSSDTTTTSFVRQGQSCVFPVLKRGLYWRYAGTYPAGT